MIQRYNLTIDTHYEIRLIEPDNNGGAFVGRRITDTDKVCLASDVAELEAENERLKKQMETMKIRGMNLIEAGEQLADAIDRTSHSDRYVFIDQWNRAVDKYGES